jgi:integration host factor subunit alpha
MTKADIVEAVRNGTGVSSKDAALLVDHVFEMIRENLEKGEDIKLPSFGNFLVREKKQRIGRNPKTGKEIPITARKVVTFKPSQILRERIDEAKSNG